MKLTTRGFTFIKKVGQALPDNAPAKGHPAAFTLIELLVVVLIIGILAAVAVPQYQKAVEKSKATEALTTLKAVYQAAKLHKLANGAWPTNFSSLNMSIPWKGAKNWYDTGLHSQGISNKDWSIQLYNGTNGSSGVVVGRISGHYQGAAFYIYDTPVTDVPANTILCLEQSSQTYSGYPFTLPAGSYCKLILGGSFLSNAYSKYWKFYKLPY